VKLLKAIEEKAIRPVGARAARQVDVHVVAATNADLEQRVKRGEFREDLFYRLAVVRLVAPPLRERGDDVLLLARVILREICERYRLAPKTLTPDAEQAMRRWSWPGNVRELRNLLDRAALFTDGPSIDARALGLAESAAGWIQLRYDGADGIEVGLPDAGIQFEELERALIVEALRKAGGKLVGAAKLLGMTRDTLRYRVEKFGIAPAGEKE
jgi:DNA-binding NtrC family response regulator